MLQKTIFSNFCKQLQKIQKSQFCVSGDEFITYQDKMIKKSVENPSGQILKKSDQVIHYTQIDNGPKESLGKVVSLKNTDNEAVILALKDTVSMGLLQKVNPYDNNNSLENVDQTIGNLEIKYEFEDFRGQIVNFQGQDLVSEQQLGQNSKNVLPIFKNYTVRNARQKSKAQVFTGNLAIDFTKPIGRGHVTTLKGNPRTGKSHFMVQTMQQHIKESGKYISGVSKNGTYAIYCTNNYKQAVQIQKSMQQQENQDEENNNNIKNYTIYSQKSNSLADNFYTPFAALAQAQYLREVEHKDVLFIFDNVYDHYFNELNIYTEAFQPFSPVSILRNLFTCSGNFQKKNADGSELNLGSLTTFFSFDNDHFKYELSSEATRLQNEADSLSDNILDFDLKDALTMPKLKYNIKNQVFRDLYQNPLHFAIQKSLMKILKELDDQKYQVDMKKQLGIVVEPWDHYLFHDAKYFNSLLINSNYLDPVHQIVYMTFVIRSVEEEIVSQFKDNQRDLIATFNEFCNEFRDFEGEQNIYEYLEVLMQRDQGDMIIEHCKRIYELFIMHLKMNDRLRPFKKDYLI